MRTTPDKSKMMRGAGVAASAGTEIPPPGDVREVCQLGLQVVLLGRGQMNRTQLEGRRGLADRTHLSR